MIGEKRRHIQKKSSGLKCIVAKHSILDTPNITLLSIGCHVEDRDKLLVTHDTCTYVTSELKRCKSK